MLKEIYKCATLLLLKFIELPLFPSSSVTFGAKQPLFFLEAQRSFCKPTFVRGYLNLFAPNNFASEATSWRPPHFAASRGGRSHFSFRSLRRLDSFCSVMTKGESLMKNTFLYAAIVG